MTNVDIRALVLTDVCVIALSPMIHSSASVHFKVSVLNFTYCTYCTCTALTHGSYGQSTLNSHVEMYIYIIFIA